MPSECLPSTYGQKPPHNESLHDNGTPPQLMFALPRSSAPPAPPPPPDDNNTRASQPSTRSTRFRANVCCIFKDCKLTTWFNFDQLLCSSLLSRL